MACFLDRIEIASISNPRDTIEGQITSYFHQEITLFEHDT